MIVIPDEVDFELRRAAAASRAGAMRGIADILGEVFVRYELSPEVPGNVLQPMAAEQGSLPAFAAAH